MFHRYDQMYNFNCCAKSYKECILCCSFGLIGKYISLSPKTFLSLPLSLPQPKLELDYSAYLIFYYIVPTMMGHFIEYMTTQFLYNLIFLELTRINSAGT